MPDDPIDPTQAPDATGQMGSPALPDQNLGAGANTAPTLGPQGYQGPRPILMDLIQGMISPKMQAPGPGQMARPVSRAATFEDFLGNFIGALGQGFAASGHGPGSFARGFGAAATAPLQQQQQRAQFAQQQQAGQAQIESEQAKTAQTQAQTGQIGQTVTLPNGMTLPAKVAEQYLKGTQAATVAAASRLSVAQLNANIKAGQVARVEDYRDPNTGQVTGRMAYNKQGQPLGLLEGAVDPKTLGTTTTSQQWIETSPGVWTLADKTSSTRKGAAPVPAGGTLTAGGAPVIGGPATFGAQQPTQPKSRIPQPSGGTAPAAAATPTGAVRQGRTLYGEKPAVAYNPQTGEREVTTSGKATKAGMTQILPIKDGDVEKWSSATRQFNDVQINTSRYASAAYGAQSKQPTTQDYINLHVLLNKAGPADFHVAVSAGGDVTIPGLSALSEGLSRATRSQDYQKLSPQAKDLFDGYLRTLASVPAYQKALTGVGRFNKEVIEMELRNIPDPTMAPQDIARKLGQWQENIDRGYEGTPRIQGIDTPKDIRKKYEGMTEVQIPGQKSALIHSSRVGDFQKKYPAGRVLQ